MHVAWIKLWLKHIDMCGNMSSHCINFLFSLLCFCMCQSVHQWFLHVVSNVYLMWSGSTVCWGITASHLCQCSWIVSIWSFYPFNSWPRRSLPIQASHPHSPAAGLLLNTPYVIHPMLSWAVRNSMTNAAFLFMKQSFQPHTYTPIIIRSCLLCLCWILFMGMWCNNWKDVWRFQSHWNTTFYPACHYSKGKCLENNRHQYN